MTEQNAQQTGKWFSTSEKAPPEYSFLLGKDANGEIYSFHCSRLDHGATLYFGVDLNPCEEPVEWTFDKRSTKGA